MKQLIRKFVILHEYEEEIRHFGGTYDLVYSNALFPKLGEISPAVIAGTPIL
jgi:hypothetical protein